MSPALDPRGAGPGLLLSRSVRLKGPRTGC